MIAPALVSRKPGERVKTDRRDARKLAELYRAGLLTVVRAPTPAEEAVRDLCRARDDARADRQRCRHRLGKLLLRRGLHCHPLHISSSSTASGTSPGPPDGQLQPRVARSFADVGAPAEPCISPRPVHRKITPNRTTPAASSTGTGRPANATVGPGQAARRRRATAGDAHRRPFRLGTRRPPNSGCLRHAEARRPRTRPVDRRASLSAPGDASVSLKLET